MLAYALSSNTWFAVAFLTAVAVLSILGLLAKILRYELLLIKVVSSARKMRTKLEQSINEAEQANNPQTAEAIQAMKDAKTSTEDQAPASDASNVAENKAIKSQENAAAAA